MKKCLPMFLVVLLLICLSGCQNDTASVKKEYPKPVIVMPDENTAYTVNGYKDTSATASEADVSSSVSSAAVSANSESTTAYSGRYLGNINTKKIHTTQCRYIKNTKEENISIFETLNDALDAGYKQCSVCIE